MKIDKRLAALRKVVALAGPLQPSEEEDYPLWLSIGSIVANAEEAIADIEGRQAQARSQATLDGMLSALRSGNITIDGKRIRS